MSAVDVVDSDRAGGRAQMTAQCFRSVWVLAVCVLSGCGSARDPAFRDHAPADEMDAPTIAVANSFIGAVVRDLLGDDVPFLSLAEPGMCPGHFDLRPSQVRQVQQCRLLLRFDFQKSIDSLLARSGNRTPHTAVVNVTGGLCEPSSFVEASRQIADVLVSEGLLSRTRADQRLVATTERMAELAAWAREQMAAAHLREIPMMTSRHQEAFCRSLGLNVVATFPTADSSMASDIDEAVEQGRESEVRLIVANLPEGRQAADALADRFSARVVVFGNFPDDPNPDAFERLVRANVSLLVKATEP
jgi:zinc transport system substrate-binding protein